MKQITLPGTELTTSALGFGCSALLGEKTKAEGLQLLRAAFDSGIRYFDVARMYGYGQAETVVGELARGRRGDVVLATKFGIEPSAPAVVNGPIRAALRRVMKISPKVRRLISKRAVAALKTGQFQPSAAARSLETSLRALGTDHIDIYLLHDCTVADTLSDELLVFLQQARRQGKIRYFGVGTNVCEVKQICRQRPEFASIVQFGSSVLCPQPEELQAPGAVITHGSLAGSYAALSAFLRNRPEIAGEWLVRLGVDCREPDCLAGLMLSYAMSANARGPVLFQSSRPDVIRANARLVDKERYSLRQLHEFALLAAQSNVQPC
jgi:diketogulonate reductase-like aldo/keto reductase